MTTSQLQASSIYCMVTQGTLVTSDLDDCTLAREYSYSSVVAMELELQVTLVTKYYN